MTWETLAHEIAAVPRWYHRIELARPVVDASIEAQLVAEGLR